MNKILNNLGLAMRANALVSGQEIVEEYLRGKKVFYIFLASDASANTKKAIYNKAKYYNVEVCDSFTSAELNQAIGKTGRMVLGVTVINFVKILK